MELKDKKFLFIDLDGTLLDSEKDGSPFISQKNLDALNLARENGLEIIVSSGRFGKSSQKYIDAINPRYAVLCNGAVIQKNNRTIHEEGVEVNLIEKLIAYAQKHELTIKFDDRKHCFGYIDSKESQYVNKLLSYRHRGDYELINVRSRYKIVLWGKDLHTMEQISKDVVKEVPGIMAAISTEGYTIEITNENATKGNGNSYIINQFFGSNFKQSVHIGDSMNDETVVPQIELIAMSNAPEALKKVASHIGPHYKDAGVAKLIMQILNK